MTNNTEKQGNRSPESRKFAVMETLKQYASLSNLLRTLGAGILVAAVSMFLFKGWASSDDIGRYYMLLAHTVVLALTGVIIGRWVGESKGARLFLSLSLVSAVVGFSVLGGLVYSQVQWDGALTYYPQFARWNAKSLEAALTASGISFALLAPVAWIGFMALARRSALRLTVLFVLAGGALLVPVRETAYVVILVGCVTIVLLWQVVRARLSDKTLTTSEGRFARLVLFAMPAIMVGRGMYLYGADSMMIVVLSALVFLVLRQVSGNPDVSDRSRILLNRLSVLPVMSTAIGAAGVLFENHWIPASTWIPVCVITAGALLLEISIRSPHGGAGYRRLAGLLVSLGMLANLWLFPGVYTGLLTTAVGLIATVVGHSEKQRLVFTFGLVTFLGGVVHQCYVAFHVFDFGNWGALAIIGILAIASGSVLERHGAIIKARLGNWRASFQQW